MRLKHVKGAHEKIENSSYVLKDYLNYKGKFYEIFGNNCPIHLEIGMGKGNFIIEKAKKNPHINFIGIEKYDSVLVRAIEKVQFETLPNLKFIRMDAGNIEKVFDREIDVVYLNFSDPWPKDKHEKRRLTSSFYLKKYDIIFKDMPKIIQKTDNRKLFEYSLKSFTDYGYKIEDISLSLHEDDYDDNIFTEYEKKWSERGYPIYFVVVIKK